MIKYLGPKLKKLKRLNTPILPGFSTKFCLKYFSSKYYNKTITSFYWFDLLEKQKLKFNFCLNEKTIKKYLYYIKKYKTLTLVSILNLRLDVFLFNIGFCKTIFEAKQWINHGHIFINCKLVLKPSIFLKKGDVVQLNILNKNIVFLCKRNLYFKYITLNYNCLNINISATLLKSKLIKISNTNFNLVKFKETSILNYYK